LGNIVLALSTVGAYLCVELESEYAVLRTEILRKTLSSVTGRLLSAVYVYCYFRYFQVVCLVIVKHGWCIFMCWVGVRTRCVAYWNIAKDSILGYWSTLKRCCAIYVYWLL